MRTGGPLQDRFEFEIFLAQAPTFLGLADRQQDLIRPEGFGDIVVGAQFHAGDRRIDAAVGTHHDDRTGDVAGDLFPEEGHAVHFRHADITQDQMESCGLETQQTLPATLGFGNGVAFPLQNQTQHVAHRGLVIDDQDLSKGIAHAVVSAVVPADRSEGGACGKVMVKELPRPCVERTSMRPPASATILWQTVRPSPVPLPGSLVV